MNWTDDKITIARDAWDFNGKQATTETLHYLYQMWFKQEWDNAKRGALTANSLWAEVNLAHDKWIKQATAAGRERFARICDDRAEKHRHRAYVAASANGVEYARIQAKEAEACAATIREGTGDDI